MKKFLLTTLAVLSLSLFSNRLSAQVPPCDFSFPNYIDCDLNISNEIVCGSNTYCYSGSVGAGTFGTPTTANINFNTSCGSPPTSNPCDFTVSCPKIGLH